MLRHLRPTFFILVALLSIASACADIAPNQGAGNNNADGDNNLIDDNNGPGPNDQNNQNNGEPNNGDKNNGEPNNDNNNGEPNNEPGDNNNPADVCNPDAPELCDGFDNNCNDEVDEGCTCTIAEKSCYAGPPSTMGVGRCRAGVQVCLDEFYGPCEGQVLPDSDLCDGLDNDCDGAVDQDFPTVGTSCNSGSGDCASQGLVTCTPDLLDTTCNAVPITPGPELCDRFDNDCDGQIDEDFPGLGDTCEVGLGVCHNSGTNICSPDAQAVICSAQPLAPQQELCDGLDNNCNGSIDESFPGIGDPCSAGLGLCARSGTAHCAPDGLSVICDATPGTGSPEICDGLDNDCNGQVDEIPECNNQGPSALCTPEINANVLDTVTVAAIATDPNNDPLRHAWVLTSAPIGSTSSPTPVNQPLTTLFLDLAGDFTLQYTATDPLGQSASCTTIVHSVPSERLRVELIWNIGIDGDPSDVDLHLTRNTAGNGAWFNADDCYFGNCTSAAGLPWGAGGNADNPRLDLDDVEGNGPENINIDAPEQHTYRLGVHYWDDDGFGSSTVIVRIYCNAQLFREFEPVTLDTAGITAGDFWSVADITWTGASCTIAELGNPGNRNIRPRSDL